MPEAHGQPYQGNQLLHYGLALDALTLQGHKGERPPFQNLGVGFAVCCHKEHSAMGHRMENLFCHGNPREKMTSCSSTADYYSHGAQISY
jgi:hypothetical protein